MSGHDELRIALGAYALGNLDPGEMEAVRLHLEECAACRAELEGLASLPAMLELTRDMPALDSEPSPLLEAEVLAGFERPPRPARRWFGGFRLALPSAALGAAATVLVLLLAGALGSGGDGRGSPAARVALASVLPGSTNTGVAEVYPTAGGSEVRLEAALWPNRPGQIYQLWFVGPSGRISAGTFRVGPGGHVETTLAVAARPAGFERIGITRESARGEGSSPGSPVMTGAFSS